MVADLEISCYSKYLLFQMIIIYTIQRISIKKLTIGPTWNFYSSTQNRTITMPNLTSALDYFNLFTFSIEFIPLFVPQQYFFSFFLNLKINHVQIKNYSWKKYDGFFSRCLLFDIKLKKKLSAILLTKINNSIQTPI